MTGSLLSSLLRGYIVLLLVQVSNIPFKIISDRPENMSQWVKFNLNGGQTSLIFLSGASKHLKMLILIFLETPFNQ